MQINLEIIPSVYKLIPDKCHIKGSVKRVIQQLSINWNRKFYGCHTFNVVNDINGTEATLNFLQSIHNVFLMKARLKIQNKKANGLLLRLVHCFACHRYSNRVLYFVITLKFETLFSRRAKMYLKRKVKYKDKRFWI